MTMVRPQSVPGEKPLFWVGSAKDELREFPEAVKDEIGIALSVAQFGGKHPKAKTVQSDVELISRRLKMASEDYEARNGKRSR
jgi:phage-related protein